MGYHGDSKAETEARDWEPIVFDPDAGGDVLEDEV